MTIGYVKHQCEGEQRSNVRHYIDTTLRTFSPNTGKYGPEKTPHLDTFSRSVSHCEIDIPEK